MPIDPDAYMSGAIPTLSRGGSWGVPTDGHSSNPSSPTVTANHNALSQPGIPSQAQGGFFMNPLMFGRMAAFGSAAGPPVSASSSTRAPAPAYTRPLMARNASHEKPDRGPSSAHQGRGLSVVTGSQTGQSYRAGGKLGSPLRQSGWSNRGSGGRMEPVSPDREGSVRQRRNRETDGGVSTSIYSGRGAEGRSQWGDGTWEGEARAPRIGHSYAGSARPPGPMSLPMSAVQKEQQEERGHRSQPKMHRPERLSGLGEGISSSSARFMRSPLSGTSPRILEEDSTNEATTPRKTTRFATRMRTASMKLNTHHPHTPPVPALLRPAPSTPPSPSSKYLRPRLNRRNTEQVATPPQAPAVQTPRIRLKSSPHPSLDMRSMAEALEASPCRTPKHVSRSENEGYDRYVMHPDVDSPSPIDKPPGRHQQEVSVTLGSWGQKEEYLPMGYPKPPRDMEWNRDGPTMKTHGIAWNMEAAVLPVAPEGPRWVQARPPRAATVEGGAWWESGGE